MRGRSENQSINILGFAVSFGATKVRRCVHSGTKSKVSFLVFLWIECRVLLIEYCLCRRWYYFLCVILSVCVCNGVWVVVSLLCDGPVCLWLVGCGPVLTFLGYGM